ncbi:MAG: thioredoxin family protein [Gemmatimonadota bacterium]|nr:thioredoxin family protein [Gemmatimonadota bacterium]
MSATPRDPCRVSDGFVAVLKADCPTCRLIEPVLSRIEAEAALVVYTQDDPGFPSAVTDRIDDAALQHSFELDIETVPTLIRFEGGAEVDRTEGWSRSEWERVTGTEGLGSDLPEHRPGCGSKSVEPGAAEALRAKFGDTGIEARSVAVGPYADPIEACFDRGWTDGLPVVPPTPERVLRMLAGTPRAPDEAVGRIPPDLAECTVEKVAINAVLAGCRPEFMPLLLGIVEAALVPEFTLHAVTCSTCFSAPVIIVNGPIAARLGMNCGLNVLGPGNRANATIGRALNLLVRNVGGGRPGEIDRATFGSASKFTQCFAEDESDPDWEPLSVSRGIEPGVDAVTLFQGEGVQGFIDQKSRTPGELTRSLALSLFAVGHPRLCEWAYALLLLSPEHYAIYRDAGWGRGEITEALHDALHRPGSELVAGAGGVGEGIEDERAGESVPKFHADGLLIARAGGPAGLFSAILAGWPGGRAREDSHPITRRIIT